MTKKQCRLVAYRRVSTDKQGIRGLGMQDQEAAIAAYVAASGCILLETYVEVESGRKTAARRPELARAIAHAKRTRATLVIAKLDRLARNVHFISGLKESGVEFVALDLPGADRRTVNIMAAVAEGEADDISKRTKAGLAALKARGYYSEKQKRIVTLGRKENLSDEARAKGRLLGAAAARRKKNEHYAEMAPMITDLRAQGLSLYAIAKQLNELGEQTRNGKPWNAMQVQRILKTPEEQVLPLRAA